MMFYLVRLTLPAFTIVSIVAAGAPLRPALATGADCGIVAPALPDRCSKPLAGSGLMVLAQAAAQGDLTAEQRARLKAEVARVPSDLRGRFDVRYRAWKYSWWRKPIIFSSSSSAVRPPSEFRALISLGPGIIPLLVDKLIKRDEFRALQAYDALQDRPELRVESQQYPSEQQRALETARRWLDRP
jgi:hypothetical protein